MKNVRFTEEQSKVIHHGTCNLLVSAAAGSGKTAVLVQRIMELVLDGPKRTDIDRILVVTFTRNAASQMKERILEALEKRIEQNPEDAHLLRQSALIHQALITTIDSFCQTIVKSYFHKVDIDPSFRIGEEAELKLLWEQAVSDVLEEAHEEGEEHFRNLVDAYGGKKNDEGVEELIGRLNRFAESNCWPEEWLVSSLEYLRAGAFDEQNFFFQFAFDESRRILSKVTDSAREALRLAAELGLSEKNMDVLFAAEEVLTLSLKQNNYVDMSRVLSPAVLRMLPGNLGKGDKEKQGMLRACSKAVIEAIRSVRQTYFFLPAKELQEDMAMALGPMEVLVQLTIKSRERYRESLRENNILGFSDIEHLALEILVNRDKDGRVTFTDVARIYSEQFDEIMIDEYQDSNLVQDLILRAVSKEHCGQHNMFVVGDVKQSIYKFRMARPELFLEKYERYREDDEHECRIDLAKNFRSRKAVLDSINAVFEVIMTKALGKIAYDEKVKLYPGAEYPCEWSKEQGITELILVTDAQKTDGEQECEPGSTSDKTARAESKSKAKENTGVEASVSAAVSKIRQMVRPGSGYLIKDGEGTRPVRYGDIVVLLRSLKHFAEPLREALLREGIEASISSVEGYFNSIEVKTILELLRILDNPFQDIPMAAVLRSPIGGFSDADLALLKLLQRGMTSGGETENTELYRMVLLLAKGSREGVSSILSSEDYAALSEKCRQFEELYEKLQLRKQVLPVAALLEEIYRMTGYLMYCQAMPGGQTRKNHLEVLVKKAREFRNFRFTELSDFVGYIDRMITYNVDMDSGNPADSENSVRIMTIHASKGLEFPVVILPDLQREFHQGDGTKAVLLHEEYGIGPMAFDLKKRTKADTLAKAVLKRILRMDSLGEELRILYTAMTRAKEKLILIGECQKYSDVVRDMVNAAVPDEEGHLCFETLSESRCYLDWVLPAVILGEKISAEELYDMETGGLRIGENYSLRVQTADDIWKEMAAEDITDAVLHENGSAKPADDAVDSVLAEREAYRYPYREEEKIPVKVSVSQLKMSAMEEAENGNPYIAMEHPKEEGMVPKFLHTSEVTPELGGTDRGTLYHRMLELHDFTMEADYEALVLERDRAVLEGKIQKECQSAVSVNRLLAFYRSEIGLRMKKAACAGKLSKEQNFVLSYPAETLFKEYHSTEPVLVQGIIDVFFEEDDGLVLLDYKTDRVTEEDGEEILRGRYRAQLMFYADALTRGTGKKVKECLIYSFALQKCFEV